MSNETNVTESIINLTLVAAQAECNLDQCDEAECNLDECDECDENEELEGAAAEADLAIRVALRRLGSKLNWTELTLVHASLQLVVDTLEDSPFFSVEWYQRMKLETCTKSMSCRLAKLRRTEDLRDRVDRAMGELIEAEEELKEHLMAHEE